LEILNVLRQTNPKPEVDKTIKILKAIAHKNFLQMKNSIRQKLEPTMPCDKTAI